jgi:hypothetical protein
VPIGAPAATSVGGAVAIACPHLLIPVPVRIPDDSGQKSTEALALVGAGGTQGPLAAIPPSAHSPQRFQPPLTHT